MEQSHHQHFIDPLKKSKKRAVVFASVSTNYDLSPQVTAIRPLVVLMEQTVMPIQKLYYFLSPAQAKRADQLQKKLTEVAPNTEIIPVKLMSSGRFIIQNMEESYKLYDAFFDSLVFDITQEEYFLFFGMGNSFAHSFMLAMLMNIRKFPMKILQIRYATILNESPSFVTFDCSINNWMAAASKITQEKRPIFDKVNPILRSQNDVFNGMLKSVEQIAVNSTAPILLSGETGSGKSFLARQIYQLRKNKGLISGEFFDINCATLRGDTALSSLFGHVKGSFTNAISSRKGYIQAAHKGILFLDEIGELSLEMQVLLLKAIEEKAFLPFGADSPVHSDFQLICATNRDLEVEVREGRFRFDLLSRINLWHFTLPPLRERPEDIEPNINYELKQIFQQIHKYVEFTDSARKKYMQFALSPEAIWAGNFRTLTASIERMATFSFQGIITEEIVDDEIKRLKKAWSNIMPLQQDTGKPVLSFSEKEQTLLDSLDLFDRVQLEEVIRVCRICKNRSEAGRVLFSKSRDKKNSQDDTSRLNHYLKSMGLTWEEIKK